MKKASIVAIVISIIVGILLGILLVAAILLRVYSESVHMTDDSGNIVEINSHSTEIVICGIVASVISIMGGFAVFVIMIYIMFKIRETPLFKAENSTTHKILFASLANFMMAGIAGAIPVGTISDVDGQS